MYMVGKERTIYASNGVMIIFIYQHDKNIVVLVEYFLMIYLP